MRPILFSIGNIHFYSYGLMIAIGILAAFFVMERRAPRYGLDKDMGFTLGIFAVVGGVIGAKLLYILVELPNFLANPALWKNVGEGFVIYGGILGGLAGGLIGCRIKKQSFVKYFDLFIPSVALAQGFGRLGCFFAGCCYGRQTDSSFCLVFPEGVGSMAPTGIPLIPTQLISSAANFLHFFILVWFARRAKKDGQVGGLYMILYSIGRFLIEGLRNDPRGSVGPFSTSQFISLLIFVAGVLVMVIASRQKPRAAVEAAGTGEAAAEENATAEEEAEESADVEENVSTDEPEKETEAPATEPAPETESPEAEESEGEEEEKKD